MSVTKEESDAHDSLIRKSPIEDKKSAYRKVSEMNDMSDTAAKCDGHVSPICKSPIRVKKKISPIESY